MSATKARPTSPPAPTADAADLAALYDPMFHALEHVIEALYGEADPANLFPLDFGADITARLLTAGTSVPGIVLYLIAEGLRAHHEKTVMLGDCLEALEGQVDEPRHEAAILAGREVLGPFFLREAAPRLPLVNFRRAAGREDEG